MILEYALVFVLTIVAGGWSIPAGILFGLNPLGVYLAATLGSVGFTLLALSVGGRWRDRLQKRFFPDAEDRVASSRAGEIMDRWGVVGLATVGATLLGPSVTLMAALVLGVDRTRFLRWYLAVTVVSFALLTVFWVAVT